MAANVGFNRGRFIELVAPMLQRKRFTYGNMDSLNELVFSKRKKVDPQFRVPQSHINRFQPIPESSSDSGQSEVDSDTDDMSMAEVTSWIQNILQHVTVIMNALDDTQCKKWVNKFSSWFGLTMKQRSRLSISVRLDELHLHCSKLLLTSSLLHYLEVQSVIKTIESVFIHILEKFTNFLFFRRFAE